MEDYTKAIENLTKKRDYFYNMEFYGISSDFSTAINVIEKQQKYIKELEEKISILEASEEKENAE